MGSKKVPDAQAISTSGALKDLGMKPPQSKGKPVLKPAPGASSSSGAIKNVSDAFPDAKSNVTLKPGPVKLTPAPSKERSKRYQYQPQTSKAE